MSQDEQLTPEEKRALQSLPRERLPGHGLEEKTVRALRQREILRPRPTFTPLHMGLAAAAGFVLFFAGVLYGQWRVDGSIGGGSVQQPAADTQSASELVELTGTAYVNALSSFALSSDSTNTDEWVRGRRAALEVFREAANEVVVLVPEDPLVEDILRGMEQVERTEGSGSEETRHIVWF